MIAWIVFKPDGQGTFRIIDVFTSKEKAEAVAKEHGTDWVLAYPIKGETDE